jgi:hypothetical protein
MQCFRVRLETALETRDAHRATISPEWQPAGQLSSALCFSNIDSNLCVSAAAGPDAWQKKATMARSTLVLGVLTEPNDLQLADFPNFKSDDGTCRASVALQASTETQRDASATAGD